MFIIDPKSFNLHCPIRGIIHIGAHECEELNDYNNFFKIPNEKIIWIDALEKKVNIIKKSIPNVRVFKECVSDSDNEEVSFMITSNYQSSSILNFKEHLKEHPTIFETGRITLKTKTLNTFYEENKLNPIDYNFMNIDIQGAELKAFKGATKILPFIDYIYTEVNIKEMYEGCGLMNEIDDFLEKYRFKRVQTSLTPNGWGDALYVKME